jgi:hypothetical protein
MRRSGLIAICGLRTPLPRRTPATSSWRSRPSWRASQARWRAVLQKATASLAGPDSPTHEPAHGLDEVTALNPCPATAPTTLVDAISPSPTVRARPPRGTRRAMPIAAIDKAASPSLNHDAFATGSMSGAWRGNHASSAAASRATLTLCASHKAARWAGRSVMEFTVPLCRGHHREVHRCGIESAWWRKVGIDPTHAARALWLQSHPLPSASTPFDEQESPGAPGA